MSEPRLPAPAPAATWQDPQPLPLELGGELAGYRLAYRTWGRLNAAADNAVIVCHALTGNVDADDWWSALFGDGKALDPARDFIVCSNVLGGCSGSSGPTDRDAEGQRLGPRFPALTVRDQVRAQIRLADALGVRGIRLVIGGSMGGLQALEWALLDPQRVRRVASVAASARHSTWCIAISEAQRMALRSDAAFKEGRYADDAPPRSGLAAARAIAMISYRSPGSLGARFDRRSGLEAHGPTARRPDEPAVRGWLEHHGEALVRRFDANSYLTLIDAMDRHDVGDGRGGVEAALARITQPVLVVSIPEDQLYRPEEQQALARGLPNARLAVLDSAHGHDGFLIDADRLEPLLRDFLIDSAAVDPDAVAITQREPDSTVQRSALENAA